MFLSRYVISKKSIIYEIDPSDGSTIRRFKQPKNWEWDPERSKARWEKYRGKVFFVFKYNGRFVFQEGKKRFLLDKSYSSMISEINCWLLRFELFHKEQLVYRFTYRNPKTRIWSIICSLGMDDDWWDWDTPFEDVKKYLDKINAKKLNQS